MLKAFSPGAYLLGDDAGSIALKLIFFSLILGVVQWLQYYKKDLMFIYRLPAAVRAIFYLICFYAIMLFGVKGAKEFIYFQF
jgi:hypothetical protein